MADGRITRRIVLGGVAAAAANPFFISERLFGRSLNELSPGQNADAIVLPPIQLRGFGTLSAICRRSSLAHGSASVVQISCDDESKALLTHAKFLSDLTLLTGVHSFTAVVAGNEVSGYQFMDAAFVAAYASGNAVIIVTAKSGDDLSTMLSRHVPAGARAVDFKSRVDVPMYLDRFDKHGLMSYYRPFVDPPGHSRTDPAYDVGQDFDFAVQNNIGLVVWDTETLNDTAEGLANLPVWEWVANECRARKLPLHINTECGQALWLTNRFRDQTMQKQPQYCGSYYRIGEADIGAVGTLSWSSEEGENVELGILQETVRRFVAYPNVVGWLEPHGETDSPPYSLLVEYGDVADRAFRLFLRTRYGSPDALSKAWSGDATAIRSWDEARVPELASFLGFGPNAIDLTGDWKIQFLAAPDGHAFTRDETRQFGSRAVATAAIPAEWYQTGFNDTSWPSIKLPGNDRQMFTARAPAVLRRMVTVAQDWLSAHPRQWLYLWDLSDAGAETYPVSVNGHTTSLQGNARPHWGSAEITGQLSAGANCVAIRLPRGFLGYRCYISGSPPLQYPALGPHQNARWVDFMDWSRASRGSAIERGAAMIRQVDRNRPINFMHPDFYSDLVGKICADYGGHFHNTGYMAGWFAEYNTLLARGAGRPATAEPGSAAKSANELQADWGRWLTEGIQSVHYFQHLGDILWNAGVRSAFKDNYPIYAMVGKYHLPRAELAILYGVRSSALTSWPWGFDPNTNMSGGYWAWNTAFPLLNVCPRDGVTEQDFESGAVGKYRVIVDSNTSIMSDELVARIEQYVRAGGTFITFAQTGRHTPTVQDSWPISRLTGYDVVRIGKYGDGNWPKDSQILKTAAGQTVLSATPWSAGVKGNGLSMKRHAPEVQDLLIWQDGSIAAGMRTLGSGRVIHVGVTFEPLGDRSESALTRTLLGQLIDYLKVARIPAQAPGVIMRHYLSNNGLYDVWVLFNDGEQGINTNLTFSSSSPPPALLDVKTGQSQIVAKRGDAAASIGLSLQPFETKVLLSPRADASLASLEWLGVQRDWWAGTKVPASSALPTPAQDQRNSLDLTEDWAFHSLDGMSDAAIASYAEMNASEADWERRRLGIWNVPDHPQVKRAMMRRRYTVPATWRDGETRLWIAAWENPTFRDRARIFIDGKMIRDYSSDGINGLEAQNLFSPGSSHVIAIDIMGNGVVSGVEGSAWIYHVPDAAQKLDLAGSWDSSVDGTHAAGSVSLPGTLKALFASRNVTVDSAQSHRNVVIYIKADGPVFGVLINGELIARHHHVIGPSFLINVTNKIRFGAENHLELVTRDANQACHVSALELRFYDREIYP